MKNIPFIKEYRDLNVNDLSKVVILATATGAFKRPYTLSHHSAGYESAGSCARYTREKWTVLSRDIYSNTTHGKAFLKESEAREYFAQYTTPIAAV